MTSSDLVIIDLVFAQDDDRILTPEQSTAVSDLIRESVFKPVQGLDPPYRLRMISTPHHIMMDVRNTIDDEVLSFGISMGPYRKIIKDYFLMIESYEHARAGGNRARLEAIDMGRRGLHDEAAQLIQERLKDKVIIDHPTARRFFTLMCALWRVSRR
ncbi:MAG: UPF0262 family protein [Alphaproteobacteria bacterium]|nr:UPF0262 family protein [Alphaproteobacteria bacterium]